MRKKQALIKRVTVRLTQKQFDQLDTASTKTGLEYAELLRKALMSYLQALDIVVPSRPTDGLDLSNKDLC